MGKVMRPSGSKSGPSRGRTSSPSQILEATANSTSFVSIVSFALNRDLPSSIPDIKSAGNESVLFHIKKVVACSLA